MPNVDQHPRLGGAPDAARVVAVVVDVVRRGHGHAARRQLRRQAAVQRDPLDRDVGGADAIEVAPEPAGRAHGIGRADLPEVAGGEVRLVGRVVADRRSHGDAAAGVVPQLLEALRRRMPAQPRVGLERRAGARGQREARSQDGVARVARRREQAERVQAAVHEDRYEHLLLAGRLGDGRLEGLRRQRSAGAVHRERQACGAQQHRAAREARAGGRRHAGLGQRQPGAGARDRSAQQVRTGEVIAAVGHQRVTRAVRRGRRR